MFMILRLWGTSELSFCWVKDSDRYHNPHLRPIKSHSIASVPIVGCSWTNLSGLPEWYYLVDDAYLARLVRINRNAGSLPLSKQRYFQSMLDFVQNYLGYETPADPTAKLAVIPEKPWTKSTFGSCPAMDFFANGGSSTHAGVAEKHDGSKHRGYAAQDLTAYIASHCSLHVESSIELAEFYLNFQIWGTSCGITIAPKKTVSRDLRALGYVVDRGHANKTFCRGLDLIQNKFDGLVSMDFPFAPGDLPC